MTGDPDARRVPAGGYPAEFGLTLDPSTRRPSTRTLVGGSPPRLIRLSDSGARLLDAWVSGGAVGSGGPARRLARRLVDSCLANPRPPSGAGPTGADTTIVVPVRDRPAGLQATISSLGDLAVIVVDDASVDPVEARAHRIVRRDRAGGPGAARNSGWRAAETDIIVFVDADCRPEPGWLSAVLPHFADPAVGAVAPRVRSVPGDGVLARYEAVMSPLDMGKSPAAVRPGSRVPYVPTACLALRRRALEACGGFDETLRFGEDVDLVWRLDAAGWSVRYEPGAVVWHPPRPDARSWVRQRFDYGRSAAPLSARHGARVAPASLSPWSAAVWPPVTAGRPAAGAGLGAALPVVLANRARPDAATGRALAALALKGNILAAKSLATAVRRAWTPALILAMFFPSPVRRRAAAWLGVAFAWPVADWIALGAGGRPYRLGPLRWAGLRWADDLSYQAGLWAGSLEQRSLGALTPRWNRRPAPAGPGQAAATSSSSAMAASR